MLQLDGTGRLYHQVYRALRAEILSGRLVSGERVPSTREIAKLLKISRNTAVMAYEQLLAEGYIEARLGAAGTVVAPVLPPGWLCVAARAAAPGEPGVLPPGGPDHRRWRKEISEVRSSVQQEPGSCPA